jgi:hypothetical protein
MRKMKLLGVFLASLLGVPMIAAADTIYDWSYTDGTLSASGSLDVSGGQAVSGTGTVNTTNGALSGPESLTLVTLATPGVNNLGGGNLSYRFGGGTDLIGDTTFNAADPWVSSNGLVFLVGGPGANGLNIWANSTSPGGSYTGFLAGTANYEGTTGTFTVTLAPVPLPAALPLLLSGLGGICTLARRRRGITGLN